MAFNYDAAKAAGYSDDEIGGYLANKNSNGTTDVGTQSSSPTNGISDILNKLGGAAEGVYNFVKPKTYSSMVEPVAQLTAGTIPQIGNLIKVMKGQQLNPEEQGSVNEYQKAAQPLQKDVEDKFTNPYNYLGAGGELATMGLAGKLLGPLYNAAGGTPGVALKNLLPWLISRGGTGAITSGIYGATRPEEGSDIGARLKRGAETAPIGGLVNVGLSGLLEGAPKLAESLGTGIKNEAQYMMGKNIPTIEGKNLGEVGQQENITKDIMNKTSGWKPETIIKQAQSRVEELKNQVDSQLGNSDLPINENDISNKLSPILDDYKTGIKENDTSLNSMFSKAINKLTSGFSPAEGEAKMQGTVGGLYNGKENLGKFMTTQGVWSRLSGGTATPSDYMLKEVYNSAKDIIDKAVQSAASSDPVASSISDKTEEMSRLIQGGLGMEKTIKGGVGNPSLYSIMRGLPFFNEILPYIKAGEIGGIRGISGVGSALEGLGQNASGLDALKNFIPLSILQNLQQSSKKSTTGGLPSGYMKVSLKSSGDVGLIPESQFDPSIYDKMQ